MGSVHGQPLGGLQQLKIDLLKQAAVSPIVEIALHRRERGKSFGSIRH
jgi:hypothetical protein